MGFPSMCSCVIMPKALLVLVLLLDRMKLLVSTPLFYLGLYYPDQLHSLVIPSAPASEGDHAYRLSAADLPASPLPAPALVSIKRRLRVVQFGKLAARSSAWRGCEVEEETVCAVCLGGLAVKDEVRELSNCRHAFHRGCIDRWVDQGCLNCPLCRERLLPRAEGGGRLWVVESISYLLDRQGSAS